MPIGAKIIDALDEAILLRDKVLLILSESAIASDWVEGEVTKGSGRGAHTQAIRSLSGAHKRRRDADLGSLGSSAARPAQHWRLHPLEGSR
jgi:hypothetical protein